MSKDTSAPAPTVPDRHALQAEGKHPAPCARHCEATAYEIMLRNLRHEVEQLRSALKKANAQAEHFEREWYLRGDQIEQLREALREQP